MRVTTVTPRSVSRARLRGQGHAGDRRVNHRLYEHSHRIDRRFEFGLDLFIRGLRSRLSELAAK